MELHRPGKIDFRHEYEPTDEEKKAMQPSEKELEHWGYIFEFEEEQREKFGRSMLAMTKVTKEWLDRQ